MPTQLQLEGPALPALLERVRVELGPKAKILSAEKVRTGGLGGFFARETFELTVEVDDPPPIDLSASDAAVGDLSVSRTETEPGPAEAAPPATLLDLADRVSDNEHAAAVHPETGSFSSLLARLGVGADRSGSRSAVTRVPAQRSPSEPAAAPPSFSPAAVPAPPRPTEPTVTTVVVAREDALTGDDVVRAPLVPTMTTVVALRPSPTDESTVHTHPTGELSRLGLPVHLQPDDTDASVYTALLQSLRRLPKAPSTTDRGGEVLAVAGPLPLALDLARQMARDLGLPLASSVFVATAGPVDALVSERQQVHDIDTATVRRAAWRRRAHLTVVAIDAPLTSAGAQQARTYLAAFGPVAVWGVVEATRKAYDVGAWTRAVGGVHALALTGVEDTSDPAAVLALGIPVGRLGSRPASPAVWASLLTGRLAS